MSCDKYLELLSARLDGALTGEEERELEEHLAICPGCRAAGAQLAALQGAFPELEEIEVPEGFTQGVMDRIRAEEKPKVIPLFKRPQVRALAGLAACLVLVAGLYGASRRQEQDKWMLTVRSFNRDVVEEYADISAQESLRRDGDSPRVNAALAAPETEDAPQIAAYAAPEDGEVRKAAPNSVAEPPFDVIITFERLPEGWEELLPGIASPGAVQVSVEEARAFLHLLEEQGITCEMSGSFGENSRCQLLLAED